MIKTKPTTLLALVLSKLVIGAFIVGALLSGCNKEVQQKSNPLKALADDSGQFALPSKGNKINFPSAHFPHKNYRQEWWYLTANLETQDGQALATQWTLFRRAVEDKHWYFAHAALANASQHHSEYRNGREELGHVEIIKQPFSATIDDWQWQSSQTFLPAQLSYGASTDANSEPSHDLITDTTNKTDKKNQDWQVNLSLNSPSNNEPFFFLQGEQGFSQKHHNLNIASHYYSQPFIDVSGEVYWQGKWQTVTGKAWFDREWGSQMLADDQQGWDWFSLRLDEDTALMVYGIRSKTRDFIYGSIMKNNGDIHTLSTEDISLLPLSADSSSQNESAYPQRFAIKIEKENIDLTVDVVNNKQIMRFGIEYFEGMVTFSGSHQGNGFLEMTGYQ